MIEKLTLATCDGCGFGSDHYLESEDCESEVKKLGWYVDEDDVLCPDCAAMAAEKGKLV